ncbi:MAG TPA: CbbQ/NirQ/NorQ/GpvN family protein [Polyangiales bacterium]|nr:CbbQ/NirQ/NorQ/GpvN family protein [Polyangiales bacterium]
MAEPLHEYRLERAPYYRPAGDEVSLFEAAYASRLPLMLKGPTGCGKTRLVEHMAHRLGRPLVTVACHEDLTATDLAGRYLLDAQGTRWRDGPLTLAVRHGAICYLDEIVEARQDTLVIIHPLSDSRRYLPLDKKNELVRAHPDFLLVISYNPGYQSATKDLKASTRQRFGAIQLDYPAPELEAEIVAHESEVDLGLAGRLVALGRRTRALRGHGLDEGASTRMLIHAARLIVRGIEPQPACRLAIIAPVTDDVDTTEALEALLAAEFA